ncbi:MAG: hypothetical protein LUQ20_07405 [Candidatus Methanoperedens sp.]|jgi:hypothetical protein|nr:hypothetical protein [Candidatus Methanoperedens sp.]
MVDSIGKIPVTRSHTISGKKRNFLQRTIQKMEQWRDKARINIFQQRERYKLKVKNNQALMMAKKADRSPNLNPSAVKATLGDKPKSREYGVTHSTVPLKPKYSIVKPAERIYGNIWKELEREGKP